MHVGGVLAHVCTYVYTVRNVWEETRIDAHKMAHQIHTKY